ncbi:hypothetical protein [Pyrococcus sp. NA2]|uniref:hypothetical protein n=1 Tax=Pyrococcus sp. (strain NA2) TaxID=342949 RepID=UPI0011D23EFD|nr:hypothetical protein [Pyrococcus sp. NA2]
MSIRLEGNYFIARESYRGSRGGGYIYLVRGSKVVHISRFLRPHLREHDEVIYMLPIQEAKSIFGQKAEFLEFGFSNKGYLYPEFYQVDFQNVTLTRKFMKDITQLEHYDFEIFGDEYSVLTKYRTTVPPLIQRVWEIERKLNIDLIIEGIRGEEVHENPKLGEIVSLIFPNPRSRIRSLKEKIRFAHELYVLMLTVDSLIKSPPREKTLWITHKDWPTLVVEDSIPRLTIWYQFSIEDWTEVVWRYPPEIIREVTESIARGEYNEAEKLLGMRLPRTYREALKSLASKRSPKRIHVKPDIMVFEGAYYSRDDVFKNPPLGSILIDAKTEMTRDDVRQLKEYRMRFGGVFRNSTFIVASIGKVPYKKELENSGYTIIEDVFPGRYGEKEFQETIRDIVSRWRY